MLSLYAHSPRIRPQFAVKRTIEWSVLMYPSEKFWNRIAGRYSRRPVADEAAYQRKLKVTREHFRPDMNVLEIGCGTGSTALVHAPYVKHIHAIDISSKMIEIARDKADAEGVDNVTFEQSTIEALDVADQSVDAVLALSILHLLADKDETIRRAYSWLKPGGIFVSSTACLGDTMAFFKYIGPIGHFLGLVPFVDVFTVKDLVASLTSAGFEIDHQWQPDRGKAVFIVAKK